MLNKVILMGRITHDLELKTSQSGTAVLSFNVAVDRPGGKNSNEKQTDFIRCTAFGKRAEFIHQYFSKGRLILVEGNIKTGSYTDQSGQKRNTFEVWVDSAGFTGEKAQGGQSAPKGTPPTASGVPNLDDFEDVLPDDGAPF